MLKGFLSLLLTLSTCGSNSLPIHMTLYFKAFPMIKITSVNDYGVFCQLKRKNIRKKLTHTSSYT